ncbi:dipeptide/oligopeptide/nickel ABC transporter ATP-binding protein [Vibrio sp. JC009]|uniref:ABC transporter ATP-binding protein n=1 Tax=Vibrio sp. JC009 TaxID=2912314 RepID=UPI0023B04797|nr:dipeptide/oligopeptide/nickel ABC transporter ATP-binding protein [Vibrio sp. JC009]WED23449.1 dipeptide/oligopeptide/nickel ABC transporter ATP-binding protein [Vibrio sp. JC009]
MSSTQKTLLEIRQLDKFFEQKGEVTHVLKDINLKIRAGECVGIVGESGSGKSTLARLLCRIHSQDSGQVLLRGEEIGSINLMDYYQQVQMVFQDPLSSFPPRMKVKQYLLEPFKNFKRLKDINPDTHAKALLAKVGLAEDILTRYPNQLSGGQLQRIVFARATGINPSLLICDEATSALDATIQKQVLAVFEELREELGFACIFITHDLALAETLCDTIHVMDNGCIVETLVSGNLAQEAIHPSTRRLIDSSFAMSEAVSMV